MEQSKRNIVNTKLDFISVADLPQDYNSTDVWDKLDRKLQRANNRTSIRWALVAVISLLILLAPFRFFDQEIRESKLTVVFEEVSLSPDDEKKGVKIDSRNLTQIGNEKVKTLDISKKNVEIELASVYIPIDVSNKLPVLDEKSFRRTAFSQNDISVIQQNLGSTNPEFKRSMIKAKVFASSLSDAGFSDQHIEFRTIKIRNNEKK